MVFKWCSSSGSWGGHSGRFAWGDPLAEKYPRRMLHLFGIPVTDDDARHLVATLLVEGTPDALSAAGRSRRVWSATCTRSG